MILLHQNKKKDERQGKNVTIHRGTVKVARDFYHNWTKSILQHLKRKFWKIADALFRIS
jgi:hypothetical protein